MADANKDNNVISDDDEIEKKKLHNDIDESIHKITDFMYVFKCGALQKTFYHFMKKPDRNTADYIVWQIAFFVCHDMNDLKCFESDDMSPHVLALQNDSAFDKIIEPGLIQKFTTTSAIIEENAKSRPEDPISIPNPTDYSVKDLIDYAVVMARRFAAIITKKLQNQKVDSECKLLCLFKKEKVCTNDQGIDEETCYSIRVYKVNTCDDQKYIVEVPFVIETQGSKRRRAGNDSTPEDQTTRNQDRYISFTYPAHLRLSNFEKTK